jgi:hypothetical protein
MGQEQADIVLLQPVVDCLARNLANLLGVPHEVLAVVALAKLQEGCVQPYDSNVAVPASNGASELAWQKTIGDTGPGAMRGRLPPTRIVLEHPIDDPSIRVVAVGPKFFRYSVEVFSLQQRVNRSIVSSGSGLCKS